MIENIYQALAVVMSEVGYVQKTKSTGVNYTFASETAFIEALRPSFVTHGIVVHPLVVNELRTEVYQTSRGSSMNRTLVSMVYRFAHAPSGTYIDVAVTGEGADVGDKSANKALTGAYKYALRQTLLIETGDDPDKDASEQQERFTDADRERMAGKFVARVTKVESAVDDDASTFWGGLNDVEKRAYAIKDEGLVDIVADTIPRYSNQFAARAALLKVNPVLKESKLWPNNRTSADGQARVRIYQRVKKYADLRDADVPEGEALRQATN